MSDTFRVEETPQYFRLYKNGWLVVDVVVVNRTQIADTTARINRTLQKFGIADIEEARRLYK